MTDLEQQEAAHKFVNKWLNKNRLVAMTPKFHLENY
jgi:hypothetical protein